MLFSSDVLCVGSATIDTFLTVNHSIKKIRLGDKVLVNSIEKHSGGGATNSAVALAKLGLKVKILTKLGQDNDGEFIEKELQTYKIRNICQHKSNKNTDSASIIDYSSDGDRVIYVHKGASEDLRNEDWKSSDLKTKWVYLATLTGNSWKAGEKIALYAKNKGISILFNPSLYLAQRGKRYVKTVLGSSSILVLNWEEALALLGKKQGQAKKMLLELQRLGPRTVIITNGSKPIYALTGQEMYSLLPPKVKIVHRAGAGDAFTAAFLGAFIKNYSFDECLKMGQANASSVIQAIGVKHRLLSEEEALDWIKRNKIVVKKYG